MQKWLARFESVCVSLLEHPGRVITGVACLLFAHSFQAIDLTDEGFWGCLYQQIFDAPQSVQYKLMYWGTGVVGGLWHKLWPGGGLLWLRWLSVLVSVLSMVLTLHLLRPHVGRRSLALGLALAGLLQLDFITIFFEKPWVGLLTVTLTCCVYKGTLSGFRRWWFIAGLVCAVFGLSRISSVLMPALAVAACYYWLVTKRMSLRLSLFSSLWLGSGCAVGYLALIGLMFGLGHLGIFLDSLRFTMELARDTGGHHGWVTLVSTMIKCLVGVVGWFCLFAGTLVVGMVASAVAHRLLKNKRMRRAVGPAIQMGMLLSLFYVIGLRCSSLFNGIVVGMGLVGGGLGLVIAHVQGNREKAFLGLMAIVGLVLAPAGSNAPIYVMAYSLWIVLPIAIDGYAEFTRHYTCKCVISARDTLFQVRIDSRIMFPLVRRFCQIGLAAIIFVYGFRFGGVRYRDSGNLFKLNGAIKSTYAKGVYTTQARAKALNELLAAITDLNVVDRALLTFPRLPMLNVLTHMRPYATTSSLASLKAHQLRRALELCQLREHLLPVIVINKHNVGMISWPNECLSSFETNEDFDRLEVLNRFLLSHEYAQVWENSSFSIYATKN